MKDKQVDKLANAFFAQHKDTIPYHKSYLIAQQGNILDKIEQLRRTRPDLPLTKVVTAILTELPENMAPRLVRELTLFIIEAWENAPVVKLEKTAA